MTAPAPAHPTAALETVETAFAVPTRDQVAPAAQQAFDALTKGVGFVPNLYATFAHSPTALGDYLALQNRRSSLRPGEREVINLVVSQVNRCAYCLAAHTAMGRLQGFTDAQILEVRGGTAGFDARLDALARFARAVTETRGHPGGDATAAFLAAGFTPEHVVDAVMVIGDKTISNYLHGVTGVPVDFPAAPALGAAVYGEPA